MTAISAKLWDEIASACGWQAARDPFTCGRYATDASPYQVVPHAVVWPRSERDVQEVVSIAQATGITLTARGGGTGTAGQSLSAGLCVDLTRGFSRLVDVDAAEGVCVAGAGMTLAALQAALRGQGWRFPLEAASARQGTLGGFFANDAFGIRVRRYGSMAANVLSARCVFADGSVEEFGDTSVWGEKSSPRLANLLALGEARERPLRDLISPVGGGYGVQHILPAAEQQNMARLFAGAEGTLGIVTQLRLKLAHRERVTALGICRFADTGLALKAVPAILALDPSAAELVERVHLPSRAPGVERFLASDAGAYLLVEFDRPNPVENTRELKALDEVLAGFGRKALGMSEVIGEQAQRQVWRLHRESLRHAMGGGQGQQVVAYEVQVGPQALASLSAKVEDVFGQRGLTVAFRGSVSLGRLQVWCALDPAREQDRAQIRDIADALIALAVKAGGNVTAGYGLGLMKSELWQRHAPAALIEVHREIKGLLDPNGIMNPGKLVDAPRFDDPMLFRTRQPTADKSRPGSLAAFACTGLAACLGTPSRFSCPSHSVTGLERDSPRGRANTRRLVEAGLLGDAVAGLEGMREAMRLCVSCKACRSACPNSVDVSRIRAETEESLRVSGRQSAAQRLYRDLPHLSGKTARVRRFLNLRDHIPGLPRLTERVTGLPADRAWPRLAAPRLQVGTRTTASRGTVALFADTFNRTFEPANLRAAAHVLEAAGYVVEAVNHAATDKEPLCCGRTAYDTGDFDLARSRGKRLLAVLDEYHSKGIPIVGLEPLCVLMMRDEYRYLGLEIGEEPPVLLFEEFVSMLIRDGAFALPFKSIEADCVVQPHCHERAAGVESGAATALGAVTGLNLLPVTSTCCGLNGLVGFTPDTLEASLAMGETALFPAIRKAGRDALVSATGFFCRRQIQDGTGATARHPAMLLDLALRSVAEVVS
jgi:FAD/FMN-containing dehydrogenase/Fe-S oxidoreductase